MDEQHRFEIRNIRKVYPGTVALTDFSATFVGGEVHALVGKNGSGKSTTVKILSGAEQPTSGEILIDGRPTRFHGPRDAMEQGIAMVYQELSSVPDMSVMENLLIGRYPRRGLLRARIDWSESRRFAQEALDVLDAHIPLEALMSDLSVGQQQLVEIAKAMSFRPLALILDEPTSALARHETDNLFATLSKLREKGVAIIYITHRLGELYSTADRVSVLLDGDHVGTVPIADAGPEEVVNMMFGEVVKKTRPGGYKRASEKVLSVRNLTRQGIFENVSFDLHRGEVLGIAGMLGAGRTELVRAIFGADPVDEGHITVGDTDAFGPNPQRMKKLGLAMTPEDRKGQGLIQGHSIASNLTLAAMRRASPSGIRRRSIENEMVQRQISSLEIRLSTPEAPVSSLSGGNQQKVVIGNWINDEPQVVLFDEPTRGIDVNAKQQIFEIMWNLSAEGIASIFISTELEELLEVCHRILVMKYRTIAEEIIPEEIDISTLYTKCMEEHV